MSQRPARMTANVRCAAPDWCHFTQRLPRSRAHKQIKGAELPFEDEKFSYVALTRAPGRRASARVLAQPVVTKVEVTAKLCTVDGLANASAPAATRRPTRASENTTGATRFLQTPTSVQAE